MFRFKRSVRYNLSEPVAAGCTVRAAAYTEPVGAHTVQAAEHTEPVAVRYTERRPEEQYMVPPAVRHTVLSAAVYTVKAVHADR